MGIFSNWGTNYGFLVTNIDIQGRMEIISSFFGKCVDKMEEVW